MKKLFTLLFAVLFLLSLSACVASNISDDTLSNTLNATTDDTHSDNNAPPPPSGNDSSKNLSPESSEDTDKDNALPPAATKTLACFYDFAESGEYTMEMRVEYGGTESVMTSAFLGGMMYSETSAEGVTSVSIMKDGVMYILDHASKSCYAMSMEISGMQELFSDEAENYETPANTGETDVNGSTYYFEEFVLEGENVKYCFDGDNLKYILTEMDGETYIAEILKMENGADASLFEIPADYNIMKF